MNLVDFSELIVKKLVKEPVCVEPRKTVGDDVKEIARSQIMLVSMGHGFY